MKMVLKFKILIISIELNVCDKNILVLFLASSLQHCNIVLMGERQPIKTIWRVKSQNICRYKNILKILVYFTLYIGKTVKICCVTDCKREILTCSGLFIHR